MSVKTEAGLRNAVNVAAVGVSVVIILESDVKLTETSLVISANKHITLSSMGAERKFFKLIGASGKETLTVNKGGVLELAGIIVTHANATTGRGVTVQTGGTLTLVAGAISGNTTNNIAGGGVHNSGNFSITGGTITNNTAVNGSGGGIFHNSGNLTIEDGTITNNTAVNGSGGGIFHNSGNLTIKGGTITNNTATNGNGSDLFHNKGTLTITGGTISNTAANSNGNTTPPSEGSSLVSIKVPPDASDEEKAVYNYIQDILDLCEIGRKICEGIGLIRVVERFYSTAVSSVSAMRYTVDCLLDTIPESGRLSDWDEIAALDWASPAPYFFEGLVHEAQDRISEAAECYRKAALNPCFSKDSNALKVLKDLDVDALENLRIALVELEDKIFAKYRPEGIAIPRHENNFDLDYLNRQAQECLNNNTADMVGALMYFAVALQINPINGDNYAGPVIVYLFIGDVARAIYYLNDGLLVDPENVRLNVLLNSMEEAQL